VTITKRSPWRWPSRVETCRSVLRLMIKLSLCICWWLVFLLLYYFCVHRSHWLRGYMIKPSLCICWWLVFLLLYYFCVHRSHWLRGCMIKVKSILKVQECELDSRTVFEWTGTGCDGENTVLSTCIPHNSTSVVTSWPSSNFSRRLQTQKMLYVNTGMLFCSHRLGSPFCAVS
jgi:hypothetical protein